MESRNPEKWVSTEASFARKTNVKIQWHTASKAKTGDETSLDTGMTPKLQGCKQHDKKWRNELPLQKEGYKENVLVLTLEPTETK